MSVLKRIGPRVWSGIGLVVLSAVIAFVETHQTIPCFRVWTFACLTSMLAIATVSSRGHRRDGFLVLTALGVGLCCLELGAVLIVPKTFARLTPNWTVRGPPLGWELAHEGIIHARETDARTGAVIFDVGYTIDATLSRHVRSSETKPTVVFFGGSFTYGDGLDDADTLPQKAADLFPGRVLNFALSGYGPQQVLRALEIGYKEDVIGPNPRAFVFLTSPFHAMRTACKESWIDATPRYVLVDDKPVFDSVCYPGFWGLARDFLENTALYRVAIQPFVVHLTHADVDLYIKIVAEAVRLAKTKYGADMLVPFLDTPPGYLAGTGYDNAMIVREMEARGVTVIDTTLRDDPAHGVTYTIKGDGHPNAAANGLRAERIVAALKQVTARADTAYH